jgi:hypothetical protein
MNKKYFNILLISIQAISLQVFAESNSAEKSIIFNNTENTSLQTKKSNIDFFASKKNQEALYKRQKDEDFIEDEENFSNTSNMGKDQKIEYYLKNNNMDAIKYITSEIDNTSNIKR